MNKKTPFGLLKLGKINRLLFLRKMLLKCFLLITFVVNAQTNSLENVLINYGNVRDFSLSQTGNEAYFTVLSPQEEISVIVEIQKEKGTWSQPKIVNFSGKYRDLEPFLSPDGLNLYFASNRPLNNYNKKSKDFDIWMVERKTKQSEWSQPINLESPVNSDSDEFFPSVAKNGNLYFTSNRNGSKGKDDIFFSELKSGNYNNPISLATAINTSGYEFNAFISPDESFLIFSGYQREEGMGSGDLYISFRDPISGWTQAVNLGIGYNSTNMDYCPYLDIENEILYFTSKRTFIDDDPPGFKNLQSFITKVNSYQNGLSRIYKLPFKVSKFSPLLSSKLSEGIIKH